MKSIPITTVRQAFQALLDNKIVRLIDGPEWVDLRLDGDLLMFRGAKEWCEHTDWAVVPEVAALPVLEMEDGSRITVQVYEP